MKNLDTPKYSYIFDLDDTILNLRVPMMQALNMHTGKAIHWKNWSGYNLEDVYNISTEEFLNVLIDYNVIERALPIPGVKEALEFVKAKGYDIHIVTARGWHPTAMDTTKKWFEEYNVPYDTINIVPLGSNKSDVMDKIENVICLVDDNVKNCNEVISRGYDAYLIDMPWNTNSTIKRLNSVVEIINHL